MKKQTNDCIYFDRILRFSFSNDEITELHELYEADKSGRYWIDKKGNIYSMCREEPRLKAQLDNGNGYLYVQLCGKNFYVHRLMASHFLVNDNPKEKTQVHHKDFNRKNNSIDNLEWVSKEEHTKIHNAAREKSVLTQTC